MSQKKRENFLDRLRVAATCAVVLLHTVTGVMDTTDMSVYPLERRVFLAVLDLVCWCVPVFVLISGYLFLNPDRKLTFGQMITKYCRRIFIALFLFGVPYAWLEQIAVEKSFRPEMLWRGFLMVLRGESWSHLWYLYLILLLYLLTPAMKRLLKRLPLPAVYVLLFALFLGSSILPFVKKYFGLEGMKVLPDGGIYFFYYICGYLFAVQGRKETVSFLGWLLPAFAAALAAGMAVSRIVGSYTVQMAYNYPFTVILALLLFGWGLVSQKRADKKRDGNVERREGFGMDIKPEQSGHSGYWERAGAHCFAVYLVHPLFLNIYYKFLHLSPLDYCIWVSLPLFFLAALLPAALTAWLLRKAPALRKWVL